MTNVNEEEEEKTTTTTNTFLGPLSHNMLFWTIKCKTKANTDAAIDIAQGVRHCVVVKRTGGDINWVEGRDVWYEDLINSEIILKKRIY